MIYDVDDDLAENIKRALDRMERRAKIAQRIGISRHQIEENQFPVPEGWHWDAELDYLLPPNVEIL